MEAELWAREVWDIELRWWQRLALYRLLEFDSDGVLVWQDALVSSARQLGKSWLLRALAGWRMHSTRLGSPGAVLHTGKDLPVCRYVQRPARQWSRRAPGYTVREQNGETEITTPDGGTWMVRARGAVYGYSADLALVDESWRVSPDVVEDGLEPTLAERPNGQLVLFSTAHRMATPLVLLRRAAMLSSWDTPTSSLMLEWSAARAASVDDQGAWREASPHWSASRQRLLEARLLRMRQGVSEDPDEDDPIEGFRAQFLNVWPIRRLVSTHRSEQLLSDDQWNLLADIHAAPADGAPLAVAVEDWYGLGAGAAAATVLADGRVLVWGTVHASRPDAYAWAAWVLAGRTDAQLLVGASLDVATAADTLPGVTITAQTASDTRTALPLLRSLARTGRLAHADDPALNAQVRTVRVVPSGAGGLALPHDGARSDCLRAAAWAAQAVARPDSGWQPFYAF
jgi:hypothetical protein